MRHRKNARFQKAFDALPATVRAQAVKSFDLLKQDPSHPSLHFKKLRRYWSVRVGGGYRALAVEADDGLVWFWIGSHAEYDRIVGR